MMDRQKIINYAKTLEREIINKDINQSSLTDCLRQMSLDELLRPSSRLTSSTWSDIFHSSGDPRREIQYGDLPKLVEEKKIRVAVCSIELTNSIQYLIDAPFEKCEEFIYLNFRYGLPQNSSENHRRLQSIAACFIHECGLEVKFEQWHNGKRVDVASTNGEMLIECGDTTAHVVPEHLLRTCDSFYVFPFPNDWDDPYMFCFTKGENWNEQEIKKSLVVDFSYLLT